MRKISQILVLIILVTSIESCDKKEDYNIQNLNHNQVIILGHRGMGSHFQYPGNTLESIIPVLDIGADGCEIDIQMTKDSVLVLFHNENLSPRTTCSGNIHNMLWDDVKQCLYSGIHGNINVLSLEDMLSSIENVEDYYFALDCKLSPEIYHDIEYRRKFLMAIKRVCEKFDLSDKILIEADLHFLKYAKQLGLKNKGFLVGNPVNDAISNNLFGVGATVDTDIDTIKYAHSKGLYVMMWGAKNDIGNKKALRLSPDIIQTDKPIPLLMLLDRMNYNATYP